MDQRHHSQACAPSSIQAPAPGSTQGLSLLASMLLQGVGHVFAFWCLFPVSCSSVCLSTCVWLPVHGPRSQDTAQFLGASPCSPAMLPLSPVPPSSRSQLPGLGWL